MFKSTKNKIKEARNAIFDQMQEKDISSEDWKELNRKYQGYTDMLMPTWSISPDTALAVFGNLLGIILILKHEKIDIITSKALNFVLRSKI